MIIEIKNPIKILNHFKAMKIRNKVFFGQDAKIKEQKKHLEVVNECTCKPISII